MKPRPSFGNERGRSRGFRSIDPSTCAQLPPSSLEVGGPDVGVWAVGRAGTAMFGKASTEPGVATASVVAVGSLPTVSVPVVLVPGKVHEGAAIADAGGALLSAMGIQPDDDRLASPPQTPLLAHPRD